MEIAGNLELADLKNIIRNLHEKYKYDFSDYAISSLQRRIIRFMNIRSIVDVSTLISRLCGNKSFFDQFVAEITVNTTEMFRDPSMWLQIKYKIIPLIKDLDTIRIWHSGCSSGEEVYSMCILLKEEGLLDKAKIYATDLNEDVIAKAKRGQYPIRNMELNTDNYKKADRDNNFEEYYSVSGDVAQMDIELLRTVNFKKFDLATEHKPFLKFDVIFCRNVMIYFNSILQDKVIKLYRDSLFNKGYLIVGAQETISMSKVADDFTIFDAKEKIFALK